MDEDAYRGREQTAAKHFILENYLETLAYKVIQGLGDFPFVYIDAFSGPWESQSPDYSDTSFMLAIRKLKSVRETLRERGMHCPVRCIFVEEDGTAYRQLEKAVSPLHDPSDGFEVYTFNGPFLEAVPHIMPMLGMRSFTLTFIDPTGWTGYEFDGCANLLSRRPGELLLNYMDSFIRRFVRDEREHIKSSFYGILGGPDWRERLDRSLPEFKAVEALFQSELRQASRLRHLVSTPIMKVEDRQCFSIVYGTRSPMGLKAYREVESKALMSHEMRINKAKEDRRLEQSGIMDMFAGHGSQIPLSRESEVKEEKARARLWLEEQIRRGCSAPFSDVWPMLLERFSIRWTDARDVCRDLAKDGVILNTWKAHRRHKPGEHDVIERV